MSELKNYTPSAREKIKAYVAQLMGDDREANVYAERLTAPLDYIPGVGNALAANDAGRHAAEGNYGEAALDSAGVIGGGLTKAMLIGAGAKLNKLPGVNAAFREFLDGVSRAEIPASADLGASSSVLYHALPNAHDVGPRAASVLNAPTHFKAYPELQNMNVTLPKGGEFRDAPYAIHYRPGFNQVDHNLWIDPQLVAKLSPEQRRFQLARALHGAVANVEKWPSNLISSSLRPSPTSVHRSGEAYAEIAKSLRAGISPDDILASAKGAGTERYAVAKHAVETLKTPEAIEELSSKLFEAGQPVTYSDMLAWQKRGLPVPSYARPALNQAGGHKTANGYPLYNTSRSFADRVMKKRIDIGNRLYTEMLADNAARRDLSSSLREIPFEDTLSVLPQDTWMRISK